MAEYTVDFPGVSDAPVSGPVDFGCGVQAGRLRVELGQPPDIACLAGDLICKRNGKVERVFRECVVVGQSFDPVEMRHALVFSDRRLKWKLMGKSISGRFNVLDSNGKVIKGTEVPLRELVERCFGLLGEKAVNCEAIESDAPGPSVELDFHSLVDVIDDLLSRNGLSCRILPDDTVEAVPLRDCR